MTNSDGCARYSAQEMAFSMHNLGGTVSNEARPMMGRVFFF